MLVSGATATVRQYPQVGRLIVPRQWNDPSALNLQPRRWAMDNGCFVGLDAGAFVRMLEAFHKHDGCLFVTAPDVVGDAAATLRYWPFWSRLIRGLGRPVAFVAQDGITPERVPWPEMDALFIGGTTAFKESRAVVSLAAYAKARGLWVHVGRVNSRRRFAICARFGADSTDGTANNIAPDTNIPKGLAWIDEVRERRRIQPDLQL
jgi:hypothetical protein